MNGDLLIRNGVCYTGDGKPGVTADVAVQNGRIAAIGRISDDGFKRVVDASGLAVSPGFIDTHSHSDLVALVEPAIENKTTQGITLELLGQDGMSVVPMVPQYVNAWKKTMTGLEGNYDIDWGCRSVEDYLGRLAQQDLGPNVAFLVPHGNIRLAVMGLDDRAPTPKEMSEMCALLEKSIEMGAVGMSSAGVYSPSCYAKSEELIQLLKILARYRMPYVIHQRNESYDILSSMDDLEQVMLASGCHIHFSHFKLGGKKYAHLFDSVMKKLDLMASRGSVSMDQYPYLAGSTMMSVNLPPWVHDGGTEKVLERLRDRAARERMARDIHNGVPGWDNFIGYSDIENIYVTFVKTPKNADTVGKNLVQVGALRGKDPVEACFDLLLEEDLCVGQINFFGTEEHIETIMKHPLQNVCTDGILGAHPHPRVYGAFPRVLGRYVRERKVLDLPTALHKMTSRPADLLHLKDRGRLAEGYAADIVIFDPATVLDLATYEKPKQFSAGIPYVFVNGTCVVDNGSVVRTKAGQVIRYEKP